MTKDLKDRIIASYEYHDDDDTPTGRLLQMVTDDCKCEISDVLDVLEESSKNLERKVM